MAEQQLRYPAAQQANMAVAGPAGAHMASLNAAGFVDATSSHAHMMPPKLGGASATYPTLVSAGYDKTIKFWHVASGQIMHSINHPESQINSLALSSTAEHMAAAGFQKIRLYNIERGIPPPTDYEGSSKNVTAVGFESDTKWMYSGGEDNTARIWDLRAKQLTCQRIFQVNTPVNTVCLHPNQVELFVGDASGTLYSWDLRNNANEQTGLEAPGTPISIQHLAIDQDGTKLAAVTNRGMCYCWSLVGSSTTVGSHITTTSNGTSSIDVSSDKLETVRSTKFVPKKKFKVHDKYALKCAFSPDSTLLATTSADNTCRLWTTADLSENMVLKRTDDMKEPMKWVWDCAFTNDSQHIFTCSSDGLVRLWAVDTGRVLRTYHGHKGVVTALALRDIGASD